MLKVIKTLVTTIMLKLSNASIIYCNTTLIVSFASLEFQFENVNRKIQKYSICSCHCIVGTNMTGLLYSEALYMDYALL